MFSNHLSGKLVLARGKLGGASFRMETTPSPITVTLFLNSPWQLRRYLLQCYAWNKKRESYRTYQLLTAFCYLSIKKHHTGHCRQDAVINSTHRLILQRLWIQFPAPTRKFTLPVTSTWEDQMPSSGCCGHWMNMVHLHIYKQNSHTHKIKIFKKRNTIQLKKMSRCTKVFPMLLSTHWSRLSQSKRLQWRQEPSGKRVG